MRANFQIFPGGMPPDPLVVAYQVCFTYYAKLNTLLTSIFNVATMANDQETQAG